jgi:hypothetical protein
MILIQRFPRVLWKINEKNVGTKAENEAYDTLANLCATADLIVNLCFVSKDIQSIRGCSRKEVKDVEPSK